MIKTLQGSLTSIRGKRIAIVVSRFNEHITKRLLEGCLNELKRLKFPQSNITVVWVPGAFEIPVTAQRLSKKKHVQAIICLGAIVKGQTLHYELVAQESARGVQEVALKSGKPVVFEILSADTMKLVEARAENKGYNKGAVAAQVAIEMLNVMGKI